MFAILTLMIFGNVKSSVELVAANQVPESGQKKVDINLPMTEIPNNKPTYSAPTVKKPPDSLPNKNAAPVDSLKAQKRRWIELHGSLDKRYVYLMLEKTGKREVAGYLFDGKGKPVYVYGEWFKGQLQVYDQSKKRLTILLDE